MLTHQYKSTIGQNGERYYYNSDNTITEIPTDIPSDAVEVIIYSKNITTIKANVFLHLSQCTYLKVGNNIPEIEPGAFNGLTALTELSLPFNRLKRLYVNMFSGISNCKFLDLGVNRISEVEPGSFDGLGNLEWLGLHVNRLTTLRTDTFRGLSKCTQITLYDNYISEIEP